MLKTQMRNLLNGTMRAMICAAVIVGLLASFAFRQSNTAAQTAENETASFSPDASTFLVASNEPITINDTAPASPYPSSIFVSGFNPATVTRVEVLLLGFTHTFPDDVDIVLVAPNGRRTVLMSDAGGDADVSNIFLSFRWQGCYCRILLRPRSPHARIVRQILTCCFPTHFPRHFPRRIL